MSIFTILCTIGLSQISCQFSIYSEHSEKSLFWTFLFLNVRPPLVFPFLSLGWELEKMMSFLKNTTLVGWIAWNGGLCVNPTRRVAQFAGAPSLYVNRPLHLCTFFTLIVILISTRVVFLIKLHHCPKFSTNFWMINGGLNTQVLIYIRNRLKFVYLGKTYFVPKRNKC